MIAFGAARPILGCTLETLISVASRAAELFDGSKTEQKRELLAFEFSNLRLRGKKLDFS